MTSKKIIYAALPLSLMLALAACGSGAEENPSNDAAPAAEAKAGEKAEEGKITLSADQIASAGIQTARPMMGGSGMPMEQRMNMMENRMDMMQMMMDQMLKQQEPSKKP